jgi:phage portal protein BeeE
VNGQQSVITDSSVARVLMRPNPYMTQADFLEKITILLELNKNVFIYPEYYMTKGGERFYTALYPLKPSDVWYLMNEKGEMFIKMRFVSGYEVTLPNNSVIHWRKDYGVNDYFGGGMFGGDDNAGLLTMLQRYDQLTQSIAKALECSCQVNGIVNYQSYNDDEELKKKREAFENDLKHNKSGILFSDMKYEYSHIPRDIKLVDAETLKFFYDTILRANGTPLAILNGDYSKAQKESYYEHALEADIKSLGQAMSRVLFSDREASFGNEVILYANAIEFMSTEQRIAYMNVAVPAGAMSVNQILAFGGLPPVEGGDVRPRGFNNLDGASTTSTDTQTEEVKT